MAMAWGQGELFPKVNEAEIQRTNSEQLAWPLDAKQLDALIMRICISDKTANATILIEKQHWVYQRYQSYTHRLRRAFFPLVQ
ncbi:hypothetical protein ACFW1P_32335 [Paenibacillus sp. NPDC058910]|uniref:hypothetical protein n=1 Tax=unclassified Paenibacillus TaxID=185978 RepID=UPI00368B9F8D